MKLSGSGILVMVVFMLPACAHVASAQEMSPGYLFLEVTDQANQPVPGAAAVLYDEKGRELEGSVSDPDGHATLRKLSHQRERLVIRVIKPGYTTYETVFEPVKAWWMSDEIKIRLAAVPKLKPLRPRRRRSSKRPVRKRIH